MIEDPSKVLERLEVDESIPEKERKKTLNAMLAMLSYQLKNAESDVKELEQGFKNTEQQCDQLEAEMQREENQIAINNIRKRKDILEWEIREALEEADHMYN